MPLTRIVRGSNGWPRIWTGYNLLGAAIEDPQASESGAMRNIWTKREVISGRVLSPGAMDSIFLEK